VKTAVNFLTICFLEYFTNPKNPVQYTRSGEYRKNDNAHIEEKNRTHVPKLNGYRRFNRIETVGLFNDLYLNEWRLFLNFFYQIVINSGLKYPSSFYQLGIFL